MTAIREPLKIGRRLATATRVAACMLSRGVWDLISDPNAAMSYWRQIATISLSPGGDDGGELLVLPKCDIDQLIPVAESIPVTLIDYRHAYGDVPLQELITLCKIARYRQPRVVFEIGTYLGGTTVQIAANSDAKVYTLDLPPPNHKDYVEPRILNPELDVFPDHLGVRIQDSPHASKIHQLVGDSLVFDFTPYHNSVDFVFIDGSHHYDCVFRDSQNALRMKSGRGVIIWHDYAPYAPGVVKALNDLGTKVPLVHIADTSLVLHCG